MSGATTSGEAGRGDRRGRPPRGLGFHLRWASALGALLVVLLAGALLATALRPAASVADARGAALTLGGPAPTAYPWSGPVPPAGQADADPWGFTQGQCTSYVAWWLNTHGVPFATRTRGPAGTGSFGDASTWDAGARRAGFTVTATPRVGSVAQWHAGEVSPPTTSRDAPELVAGEHGHVAVVVAVGRGQEAVTIGYDGATHVFERLTTRAPRYLEIGALPRTTPVELPTAPGAADGRSGAVTSGPRVLSCR